MHTSTDLKSSVSISETPKEGLPIELTRTGSWFQLLGVALATGIVLLAGFAIDIKLADVRPINERPPSLAPVDMLRSATVFLAAAVFVGGILLGGRRKAQGLESESTHPHEPLGSKRDYPWVIIGLQVAVALLFVVSPPLFSKLSLEDGIVEWSSAIFAFASAGVLGAAGWRLWRNSSKSADRFAAATLMFSGFVCFVLGGEEASWFQRVLDLETPAALQGNLQNEMNLHNFETNAIEVAYYFASWCVLVALPFVRNRMTFILDYRIVQLFAPTAFIIAAAAPLAGFNYDQWNQVPAQFMFYGTILILVWYITRGRAKGLFFAALVACVMVQGIFLYFGHRLVRFWEITEYREFFIPLIVLVVASQTFRKVRSDAAT